MVIEDLPRSSSPGEDLDPPAASSIVPDGEVGLGAPVVGVEVRWFRVLLADGVLATAEPGGGNTSRISMSLSSCSSGCSSSTVICMILSRRLFSIC